jgi:hypothetical protein
VSGRIPLRIEASIDALTDTAAAHRWAWAGDTALAAQTLLRWRDHRDVITLTSPADTFDPEALSWALGHRDPPPTRWRQTCCAIVPAGAGDQEHLVVLHRYPQVTTGPRWEQLTCQAHPHPKSPPQRITSPELTSQHVVDRWARSHFELGATIDAVTLADAIGPEDFRRRCDHLPAPVLDKARTALADLTATSDPRLDLLMAPADKAAVRLAASRLEPAMRERGRAR